MTGYTYKLLTRQKTNVGHSSFSVSPAIHLVNLKLTPTAGGLDYRVRVEVG